MLSASHNSEQITFCTPGQLRAKNGVYMSSAFFLLSSLTRKHLIQLSLNNTFRIVITPPEKGLVDTYSQHYLLYFTLLFH